MLFRHHYLLPILLPTPSKYYIMCVWFTQLIAQQQQAKYNWGNNMKIVSQSGLSFFRNVKKITIRKSNRTHKGQINSNQYHYGANIIIYKCYIIIYYHAHIRHIWHYYYIPLTLALASSPNRLMNVQ